MDDENSQTKKSLTIMSLVLMIITTVYGFGNVSVSYEQMTYDGIIWFILAGVCFFFPAGLMMAEYGSAFHDAQGGIIHGKLAQLDKNRPLLGLLYGWLTGCCGWLQAPQGFGFQSLPLFLAKIQLKNGIFWACMVLN